LAAVAQRTYGDAGLYRMLAEYNGIAEPDLILVGQVIRLPANPCAAQKVAAAATPCNLCAAAGPSCNPAPRRAWPMRATAWCRGFRPLPLRTRAPPTLAARPRIRATPRTRARRSTRVTPVPLPTRASLQSMRAGRSGRADAC
jgi:hypothetical protein